MGFEPTTLSQIPYEKRENARHAAQNQAHAAAIPQAIDADLASVAAAWAALPVAIRKAIVALAKSAGAVE